MLKTIVKQFKTVYEQHWAHPLRYNKINGTSSNKELLTEPSSPNSRSKWTQDFKTKIYEGNWAHPFRDKNEHNLKGLRTMASSHDSGSELINVAYDMKFMHRTQLTGITIHLTHVISKQRFKSKSASSSFHNQNALNATFKYYICHF